jgi:hypothetical protein
MEGKGSTAQILIARNPVFQPNPNKPNKPNQMSCFRQLKKNL